MNFLRYRLRNQIKSTVQSVHCTCFVSKRQDDQMRPYSFVRLLHTQKKEIRNNLPTYVKYSKKIKDLKRIYRCSFRVGACKQVVLNSPNTKLIVPFVCIVSHQCLCTLFLLMAMYSNNFYHWICFKTASVAKIYGTILCDKAGKEV